jgi:hypothetical protein
MKKNVSGILIFGAIIVCIAMGVTWALNSYKKNIKTMTAQTSPTILHAQEVRTARFDANDERQSDDVEYHVTFAYTVADRRYTAEVSLDSQGEFQSKYEHGAKVCYDPSNPARSALAPPEFTCGSSAFGATIADPKG